MHWRIRDRVLNLDARCLVMGIVNVTPDSFSDGGKFLHAERAIAHALDLVKQGADILDIGGESTRPGSQPVSLDEELARVLPVVRALEQQCDVVLSIDTSKSGVARACLEAGAHIINDVTGLTGDPHMVHVARDFGAGLVVMHMQGTPMTMQVAPSYDDVAIDLFQYFTERVQCLTASGIARDTIAIDPGIGFGKTRDHNITLLARLATYKDLGCPICLGVSRKGFLGKLLDRPLEQRMAGSLAAAAFALSQQAAQVLRVHDVAETRDLVRVWEVLSRS